MSPSRPTLLRILSCLSALYIGCAADDDGAPSRAAVDDGGTDRVRVMVGELLDSDVKLGVIATPERLRLFFCGGPESYEDMTRWIVTDVPDPEPVSIQVDDWLLSWNMDDHRFVGSIDRDGEESRFIAHLVDPDTMAGVYEGTDACGKVGLIVTQPSPDDDATAQGACVGQGHLPEQVNPILPIAVSDDGSIRVELAGDDGPRVASVIAAAAPE